MHKDDQMTPLERKKALARGEKVDRMPIVMAYGCAAGDLLQLKYSQWRENPELRANVIIHAYRELGYDSVSTQYDTDALVGLFGGELFISEIGPNSVKRAPVSDINDLSGLDLELVCSEQDYTFQHTYEVFHRLQDAVGAEVGSIGIGIEGPFTLAARLAGAESLLRAIYRAPEQVHKLVKFAADVLVKVHTRFLKEGSSVAMMDPVASGTILSREAFKRFSKPYTTYVFDEVKKSSSNAIAYHICGNTTKNLGDMAETGCNGISIDNVVDLEIAKKTIGDKVHLVGNLPPVDVLQFGTPKAIDAGIRLCYRKAYDSPKGFTLGTGCAVPVGTPDENLYQYMRTARECARIQANTPASQLSVDSFNEKTK
ncbi:Uroporphyrinogen decarboxylase [Sporomusa silvacetica DSM 10669]|uniref:Uroporphyrinogen decarboxylase n=1 Tax=Sporomusa silvacetica DSM 10669 TaxID=1123289 RepID=A0ABZ3IH38_9FIRM|nr:uroporphyrinogen decarboxylase family protein [Sporomusa silvacetica]OZC14822.1 uroporphyrinogen decarboxylase [Sporomusa silvacetica DSM 10669]